MKNVQKSTETQPHHGDIFPHTKHRIFYARIINVTLIYIYGSLFGFNKIRWTRIRSTTSNICYNMKVRIYEEKVPTHTSALYGTQRMTIFIMDNIICT